MRPDLADLGSGHHSSDPREDLIMANNHLAVKELPLKMANDLLAEELIKLMESTLIHF